VLVVLELFVFSGTIIVGLIGGALMLITVVMAMVDQYPGMPTLPSLPQLRAPIQDLFYAALGSAVLIAILARFLPRSPLYAVLVSQNASATETVRSQTREQAARLGREGTALSTLRPGGKAMFGEEILDVITQGDLIEKGTRVRIVGNSGQEAVVEPLT
jgi:membrane-bound serine protease (ClpP class)